MISISIHKDIVLERTETCTCNVFHGMAIIKVFPIVGLERVILLLTHFLFQTSTGFSSNKWYNINDCFSYVIKSVYDISTPHTKKILSLKGQRHLCWYFIEISIMKVFPSRPWKGYCWKDAWTKSYKKVSAFKSNHLSEPNLESYQM